MKGGAALLRADIKSSAREPGPEFGATALQISMRRYRGGVGGGVRFLASELYLPFRFFFFQAEKSQIYTRREQAKRRCVITYEQFKKN